ncbi:MAG: (Fe-S)-binding protein [Herbinix sp.]|nr:(Fe-S)-binding protein [Herbinix sp.]
MRDRKIKEPIVSIARKNSEQQSVVEALDQLPVGQIIHEGDIVVITPNWVTPKSPETASVVGPNTLGEIIRYVKRFHPGKIIIATGSGGGDTKDIMNKVGYQKIIEEEQAEFVDLNYGPYMDLELDHKEVPSTKINQLLGEMDVLISFCQLKQHEEATITASIKNVALGWPPGEIHGFPKKDLGIHDDLHGFIIAMAKKIPIDLAIISADKTMIGTGPNNGVAVNTDGLIIASTDPVAADTVGARLLGYLPQGIHYLYRLWKDKIGETETKNMTFKGLPLDEAERIFSMAAYGKEIVMDKK